MEMYDNAKHIQDTFTENKLSEYLLQAQWAEFIELKKAILQVYNRKKAALKVLDIGIGDARIPKHLADIQEIWNIIDKYDGIDIAQNCIDISNNVIKEFKLEKKVSVKKLDAIKIKTLNKKYDLIISTWFTVGNFYPSKFNFNTFKPGYNMTTNDKFTMILKQAYEMLTPKGELIIGSMYIDNEATRKKQEEAYRKFGWTIITNEKDCFTATKDGWWSQRFTKQRVYDYLSFIPKKNMIFIPLDTYDYAMMVRIKK